jgi:NIMA (never in mitosis gene a)-related kinase
MEQLRFIEEEDSKSIDRPGYHEFGGYKIIECIGKGAFGSVYSVQKGDTKYAMKEILLNSFNVIPKNNEGNISDILCKEVEILKELDHPNIIKYYNSFHQEDYLYIIIELIDGMTLAEYIASVSEKHQTIPEEEVWNIFIQLCEALRYLHIEKRVVHRDIAPTNVMINRKNTVKLMDFGLAKDLEQQSGMLKSFAGTVVYSCPEIVQNLPYTSKADIWSLGCVMYELMSLKPAFLAKNPLMLAKKIVDCEYEPLGDKKYSEHLISVIKACITGNSDKRPDLEQLTNLMGGKLITYIDKMRINIDSLTKTCDSLKLQVERQESKGSMVSQLKEEAKVVRVDAKDLRKTSDPVSKVLDIVHMILHIDYASPGIGNSQHRAIIHNLARKIAKQKRNPTAIKIEVMKVR